jgi:2-polyprenyl-3-methyl-5-hydroxy-6-metoxy-1,4-benzoquinol methylase
MARGYMNPYRNLFYEKQAEWHGYRDHAHVRELHGRRSRYYQWYTRGWLPEDRDAPVLDIGCGSGQFLYFLQGEGFRRLRGVDLDQKQVEIARALGLDAEATGIADFLDRTEGKFEMIAMLDIIEHFTREELFPLMEKVVASLRPGGRLIASVPNAESPDGLRCLYTDITHEMAYTPMSFEEMLFCHGLKLIGMRDPWPAPVGPSRTLYRFLVTRLRSLESMRLRCLGLEPPRIWSNVMWVMAIKPPDSASRG